jgi:cardiolipin synthase
MSWARYSLFAALMTCAANSGVTSAFAFSVQVAEAPTSNLALTISAIQSAKKSLLVNIYEMSSSDIADAIIERVEAGVQVEILEEGQPVGGMSKGAREIQNQIIDAMKAHNAANHFFEMSSKAGGTRRYHFNHAKYAVIDEKALLIGSENYSPTGHPRSGAVGNRGWEVLVHDAAIAHRYQSIFAEDTDVSSPDIIDRMETESDLKIGSPHPASSRATSAVSRTPVRLDASFEASSVTQVTSPDTSLSGLVALMDKAVASLDLELMTFSAGWGKPVSDDEKSPLFEAVVSAARKGLQIRVLLNDETVFFHGPHSDPDMILTHLLTLGKSTLRKKMKNKETVELLNQLAAQENLNMNAAIANVKAMKVDYIHNKGALVDDDKTLISSINWNENSVEKNREAAIVLVSPQIHDYYRRLFDSDWQASGGISTQKKH